MIQNGFYKIKPEFVKLINQIGGKYADQKERPVFCCVKDAKIKSLYWAIPTSDLSHHSSVQIEKIKKWCAEKSIRSAYYHIGFTNRPAIYRISSCFPITQKHIDAEYISKGIHLILRDKREIETIRGKLGRILFDESIHPNKYEQHITDIRNYLVEELKQVEKSNSEHEEIQPERTPFNDLLVDKTKREKQQDKVMEQEVER